MTTALSTASAPTGKAWTIGLWVAQILLAAFFGFAAYMKLLMSPEALAGMGLVWAQEYPMWFVRSIGFAELAGTLGIVLPALTRIQPGLTPLAALGFSTIQVLAIGFHLSRGEGALTPFNFVVLAVALFVLWGRSRKAPIAAR